MKHASSLMACVALWLASSVADAAFSAASDANVAFTAIGPAGMKINGTTHDLAVKEDDGKIAITVALGSLTTGIDLRDKHMREKYLEVPKYPNAVLTVPRASLKLPADGAKGSFEADATLTLHGQSKPTRVRYTVKHDGATYRVSAQLRVNMNDYGIETPKYMGVSVKPDVDLDVGFKADDKS